MSIKEENNCFSITLENEEKIEVLSETGEYFLVSCINNKIIIEEVKK